MTRLTTRKKKARKKQSQFQKLWNKAEKLKQENSRFRDRLDAIIQRIESEIKPIEQEAAQRHIPLLKRLLTLGQRKSLTKWQRQELDDWIRELLEPIGAHGQLESELLDDISRYDAFRTGIELDETSPVPLVDQLQNQINEAEESARQYAEEDEREWREGIEQEIENMLDRMFGAAPPNPDESGEAEDDFFQDELLEAQQRAYSEYHKARDTERDKLRKIMLEGIDNDEEEDDDFAFSDFDPFSDPSDDGFNFGFNKSAPADETAVPVINNEFLKRLFRATAGKLHPDRESNPELREKKQKLMAQLLTARKDNDVMFIVEMYQQYVNADSALSAADEKQLIDVLKRQIDDLHEEQDAYRFESPLHQIAFNQFYDRSPRKTEQAFKQHIAHLEQMAQEAESQSVGIKSIKTLKPYLEQRYEEHRFSSPFDDIEELFQAMRR